MMKYIVFFFLVSIVGLISTAATSGFHTTEEIVHRLSSNKASTLAPKDEDSKASDMQMDQMYADLEQAAKFLRKNHLTDEVAFEMSRVALITYQRDPQFYAALILLPSYIRHRKVFEKSSERLSAEDRKLILETLQNAEHYALEGDG